MTTYRTEVTFWFSSPTIEPRSKTIELEGTGCRHFVTKHQWYNFYVNELLTEDIYFTLENLYRVEVETYLVETTHLSSQEFEA